MKIFCGGRLDIAQMVRYKERIIIPSFDLKGETSIFLLLEVMLG